jgi:hypothetical protein
MTGLVAAPPSPAKAHCIIQEIAGQARNDRVAALCAPLPCGEGGRGERLKAPPSPLWGGGQGG